MTKEILFIHGAGGYAEDGKLAAALQAALGSEYTIRYPQMPNEDAPEYPEWKATILAEIAEMNDEPILVGHSFGGSMILKTMAEEPEQTAAAAGLFLIAAPYWGNQDWDVSAYELHENFAAQLPEGLPIFLYHSRDDEWVPFAHQSIYAAKLPQATVRQFDGRGHQFNNDLSEVAADVASLNA
jgi:predicted alpha/beta hydrolase family esterase